MATKGFSALRQMLFVVYCVLNSVIKVWRFLTKKDPYFQDDVQDGRQIHKSYSFHLTKKSKVGVHSRC